MADGNGERAGARADEGSIRLRISVTGTHTRRADLEALNQWLQRDPALKEAREHGRLTTTREASADQSEAMGGELLHDVILLVLSEAARPIADSAWRSVLTWLRNRRRLADPDERPRVTLVGEDGGGHEPIHRDTEHDRPEERGDEPEEA